jgi:hypothetical protein
MGAGGASGAREGHHGILLGPGCILIRHEIGFSRRGNLDIIWVVIWWVVFSWDEYHGSRVCPGWVLSWLAQADDGSRCNLHHIVTLCSLGTIVSLGGVLFHLIAEIGLGAS